MRTLKFRALVTIDPSAAETWPRPSDTHHIVVRVHRTQPELTRYYNTLVCTDDQEPLLPGDADHVVTMTITDETATDFLTPGEHFELWAGHKLGHGVISRRVIL